MRQFSILVIFALAFGGAAVMYEQESRKVKGVLTQLTEIQAQLGDLQAEVNRLNGELEAAKLADRRRPGLKNMAQPVQRAPSASEVQAVRPQETAPDRERKLIASDVTSAPPVIRRNDETEDEAEWNRPTVDAEQYRREAAESGTEVAADPYQ